MYLVACGILLAVATVLNLTDRRMLALTLLVGATIFLPVPSHTQLQFYGTCIIVETAVLAYVVFVHSRASGMMAHILLAMIVAHFMGWILDGSPPLSPYRSIVKILECAQLAACVALSPVLTPKLRNRDAAPT